MIDSFISLLKDDSEISRLVLFFIVGIVILIMLKFFLKPSFINPKIFEKLILFASIAFLALIIGNAVINKNYARLWNLAFFFAAVFFRKKRIVRRYDDTVDKLGEKLSEKI